MPAPLPSAPAFPSPPAPLFPQGGFFHAAGGYFSPGGDFFPDDGRFAPLVPTPPIGPSSVVLEAFPLKRAS